jgi:aspartyl-tRNA(Asn)/glutamyl-tRNA(Gln) amidotransferase subunit A
MARTIDDVVAGLDVAVGPDPSDLRALPPPDLVWGRSLDDANVPHRVGWSPNLGYADVDREILSICQRAVGKLADLGAEVVEVDGPFAADPVFDWLAIAGIANERAVGHLRDTPDWDRLDPDTRLYADLARARVGAVELMRAFDAMHTRNLELVELFHRVPLLLCPTVAGQTPVVGTGQGSINGELTPAWVSLTYPFNLTRSPAGTVCAGFTSDGMPVGLQVVGPQHADVAVLRLLKVLESTLALDTVAPL